MWQDQAIGVLFLRASAERGQLSEREIPFCRTVANATAVALRNARVMQSLRDHTQQVTFARFEAERRLRSLKRYADLFASAADGIAVIDVDGRLLFANPRAYELVGYTEESVRGKKLRDLIHPDDMTKARRIWTGFARGEYPRGKTCASRDRTATRWSRACPSPPCSTARVRSSCRSGTSPSTARPRRSWCGPRSSSSP